jgi:hypothetical protein
MGSAGQIVHSSASGGGGNVDTLFFILRWDWYYSAYVV